VRAAAVRAHPFERRRGALLAPHYSLQYTLPLLAAAVHFQVRRTYTKLTCNLKHPAMTWFKRIFSQFILAGTI
jgi:hypothetical protein